MRVIRIIELPALDAALLRLSDWWHGLTRREQLLVGTLGVLLAVAILVYGVIKPLQASRAQSLADIRTYETLNARINAAGTLGAPAGPPPRTGAPADILTQSAQGVRAAGRRSKRLRTASAPPCPMRATTAWSTGWPTSRAPAPWSRPVSISRNAPRRAACSRRSSTDERDADHHRGGDRAGPR